MRWLPIVMLAGCVPISADEYASGRDTTVDRDTAGGLDASLPNTATRRDASVDATRSVDGAVVDSAVVLPPPRLEDGGVSEVPDAGALVEDAGFTVDAAVLEAGADAETDAGVVTDAGVIDCNTPGVLCDDFEQGLSCPAVAGPRWSECEHIDDPTGPVIEGLVGGSHALRSRVRADARSRSQRVLRVVPLDVDYFEAEFWLIVDPSPNKYYTMAKFQQEAGVDSHGEPLQWPGVSLVGSGDRFLLVVESALNANQPTYSDETELGALPVGWIHVNLKITWRPQLKVELALGNYTLGGVTVTGLPNNQLPVGRQYFTLGLYSEEAGAVQMLFDDVLAHAKKNGKLIPLP
ncbi:MAG TPA: hypothetical protein VFX59_19790 [Polyangiales bacterium]|nr:hypothetical protein [Polyangiales bacterium]